MKSFRQLLGLGGGRPPALRVLMVCSGNICRSPTAEVVLRAKLQSAGLADRVEVDSAGTQGLHAKEPPDRRAQAHARRRGYELSALRARRVIGEDYTRFHRIVAMDEGHLEWLRDAAPSDARARMELLMSHGQVHRGQRSVPDPYYGAGADFERVLDLVEDACDGLVLDLRRELAQLERVSAGAG